VSNTEAKKRLLQMGEVPKSIFVIGSPDVDIMFSKSLPTISEVKTYYEIPFKKYAIAMFHPVTTEFDLIEKYATNFVNALIASNTKYVVIYPNNDLGSSKIIKAYERLRENPNFRILSSLRFEYFLTLLKNANFIIGNSSAGIREAPYYGISTINIGTRQKNRVLSKSILNCNYNKTDILKQIETFKAVGVKLMKYDFGKGNAAQKFIELLNKEILWKINQQKQFKELE
jgi:UDP-N-acetylglucosamine 2-epimerase (hydrolysing)